MNIKKTSVFGVCVLLLTAAACTTVPENIPEDLSPIEYFQRAQDRLDRNDLQGGLMYYETFLERHPDDIENAIVAEYWVANIHRKMEHEAEARRMFNDLLEKEDELYGQVPDWPFVLTRTVLEEMDQQE